VRKFANKTSATMRRMIYNHLINQPVSELDQENTGNLMTRTISDVDLCVEGMRKFTTEVFDTGVLMLGYLIALVYYDPVITGLSVLFIPVAMFMAEKLKTSIVKYVVSYRKKSSEIADLTYDYVDNSMMYRITGMETENRLRYEQELADLEKKAVKANVLENSMQPIYYAISLIGIIFVIWLGGNQVIDGDWTLGMFSTYIVMFIALATKASKAAKLFNAMQKSQVSWKRIKPYLHDYIQNESMVSIDQGKTKLSVRDLGLSYSSAKDPVFEHLSFDAENNQIIGVTGPIAAGKSTFGIALTGLYPYLGKILIDGKELREYSDAEKSAMISYLGHRPQLMSDTLRNNISLGGTQDITPALNDVGFAEDLAKMPDGMETRVGNAGIRLSGGQQARIALARTLFQHKKIIILDDPFAAVDRKTEETILQNFRLHYMNSLVIIISHRLTFFDRFDKIILMNHDHHFEIGTHQELMDKSPVYASIYRLQSFEGGEAYAEKSR
jgi:ABC-type multidrug transport system fused ATPase/permease subunit